MKYALLARRLCIANLIAILGLLIPGSLLAYFEGYYEGGYYAESTYYTQPYYQSYYEGYYEAGYYAQNTYYEQAGYYSQGAYGTGAPTVYSFQYEVDGRCVQVRVTKQNEDPHTVIHADGFSASCDDIASNSRSLQRSVELTY